MCSWKWITGHASSRVAARSWRPPCRLLRWTPHGRVCADVGASTGGFTDCLLQHGAARVYAIDVGQGILDWKLRQDPRVVVMEETNARYVERLARTGSFGHHRCLLYLTQGLVAGGARVVSVEVTGCQVTGGRPDQAPVRGWRQQVGRGKGVIRDPAIHRQVLLDVLGFAREQGLMCVG